MLCKTWMGAYIPLSIVEQVEQNDRLSSRVGRSMSLLRNRSSR